MMNEPERAVRSPLPADFAVAGHSAGRQRHVVAAGLAIAALAAVVGAALLLVATTARAPDWRASPAVGLVALLALAAVLLLALVAMPLFAAHTAGRRATPAGPAAAQDAAAATVTASSDETFDLRTLVRRSLAPLQAKLVDQGLALRWRVDPRLPYALYGSGDALARIITELAEQAMAGASASSGVCLSLDAGPGDDGGQRRGALELRVDGLRAIDQAAVVLGDIPSAWRGVERVVAAAGGLLRVVARPAERRVQMIASLSFVPVPDDPDPILDLDRRPVLLVTEDDELARDLAEPFATWNAEPRWPGGAVEAAAEFGNLPPTPRAIVVIDGRDHLLAALGVVHHAASRGTDAPFVLLIADPARLADLAALDEGEIDGFIPAPPSEMLLAKALYALPLPWDRQQKPRGISRAGTATSAINARALDSLRALDADAEFIAELIKTFRDDAQQLLQRVEQASAAGDSERLGQALGALRRAAGHLGGVDLCATATALQRLDSGELRQRSRIHVQRLESEVDRLCEALDAVAAASGTRRPKA